MLTKKNLKEAIKKSDLKRGDLVFCHSDLSVMKDINFSHSLLPSLLYKYIIKKIGKSGTLAVPTFTYSYCNNKIFNPKNFKTYCGSLSNYIKNLKESEIYPDPNFSVAIVGKYKKELSSGLVDNTYGKNSFFDRFFKKKGKVFNINLDITSTFIHYFERENKVKYRFDKVFYGKTKINKKFKRTKSIIFVRYLKNKYKKNLTELVAKSKKFTKSIKIKNFRINVISLSDYDEIIKKNLKKNKNFLINDL